ncbi:MAG: EthD family reductase [Ktedonobacteraceae bacterium]
MVKLIAFYGQPQDPGAFDRYYQQVHAPLARKLPGLKGYTTDKPISLTSQEKSPYYMIADLYWDNMQALREALQSSEGQAVAADIQNFATGGAALMVGELEVIVPVSLS